MRLRDPIVPALALLAVYAVAVLFVLWWGLRGSAQAVVDQVTQAGAPVTLAAASEPVQVVVDSGASAEEIAALLFDRGVITDVRRFRMLLDYGGSAEQLHAGCYRFAGRTASAEAIRRLVAGDTSERRLTIPEGLRLEQVAALIVDAGLATSAQWAAAIAGRYVDAVLDSRPAGADLLGYLLPATYELGCGEPPAANALVAMMIDALAERLPSAALDRAEAAGLTLHEVLTIASVVEKEAILAEEQSLIAGVFLNRLALGIALQADPTVQFAVASARAGEQGWWPALSLEDKQLDSPYNTYVYPGLPPGPIANPGIDAILAVLEPAETEYFYFVATCDGANRHRFAVTLDEHVANVALCQPG